MIFVSGVEAHTIVMFPSISTPQKLHFFRTCSLIGTSQPCCFDFFFSLGSDRSPFFMVLKQVTGCTLLMWRTCHSRQTTSVMVEYYRPESGLFINSAAPCSFLQSVFCNIQCGFYNFNGSSANFVAVAVVWFGY